MSDRSIMFAASGIVAFASFSLVLAASPADARVVKQCKGNHFHWSKEMTASSKSAARQKAVRDWAAFTNFEYGNKWIDFRIANKQSIKCETAGIGKWTCVASAIPCKRVVRGATAALR